MYSSRFILLIKVLELIIDKRVMSTIEWKEDEVDSLVLH